MRRILLCEYRNGATDVTADGAALLIGVSVDHMLERWNPDEGMNALPTDFKRRAAKRSLHARNAVGTNTANVVLAYLAQRDWGARIDFDEAAGQQWAVIDEPT